MIGNNEHLINFKLVNGPRVIFGGNEKHNQTKGIREMHINGLIIIDIAYIERLKFNLVSTSQFCDKEYLAEFTEGECYIRDELSK